MSQPGTGAAGRSHLPLFVTIATLFGAGSLVSVMNAGVPRGAEAWGVFVAAGITLALYTFLYEDNPFFKAAEHIYVGVGLGYQIVVAWFEYIKPEAYHQLLKYALRPETPGKPELMLVPALVLSALLLARFIGRLSWISRIPVAFIVGFTAGTQIPNFINANVLKQVEGTIAPFLGPLTVSGLIMNLIILVGTISVLMYFFFSVEHRGAMGVGSRIGVWFLMVAFGASFGYTVMGRMALLVGNLRFLLGEWLRLPLQ